MKKLLALSLFVMCAFVITSCSTIIPIADRGGDILTRHDLCIPDLITPPYNLMPSNGILANLHSIRFSWDYDPRPGCGPEVFLLHITTYPLGRAIAAWAVDPSENSVYIDPSFMADCSKYYWDVHAVGSSGIPAISEPALIWTNFTATCSRWVSCETEGALQFLYNNFYPSHGSTILTLNPSLLWDLQDPEGTHCAVDNFHWEISESPTYNTVLASGDTIDRSYVPLSGSHYLEDCSLYFWRVTAQTGSTTQVSDISWFKTDTNFTSTDSINRCTNINSMCEPSTIPDAISLVSPIEGATVGKLNPQLVWTYDYSCRPNLITVVVSESPTLESPVLNITDNWGPMWTDYATLTWYLENCKTYYWQVTVASDLAVHPGDLLYAEFSSPIGMFHTDVNSTCPEIGGSTKASLKGLSLGCITLKTQFAFLDFDAPMADDYEVHIKNQVWPCHTESNDPKRLICSGSAVEGSIFANLELWSKDQLVLTQQVTTPNCQEEIKPTACPTPAGKCPGWQNGCSFNSQTCRCEYNGNPCP